VIDRKRNESLTEKREAVAQFFSYFRKKYRALLISLTCGIDGKTFPSSSGAINLLIDRVTPRAALLEHSSALGALRAQRNRSPERYRYRVY